MCGIFGIYHHKQAKEYVERALDVMKNRGRDDAGVLDQGIHCLGHVLHAMVDLIKQPLLFENASLVVNGEIYNWEALNKEHSLAAKNDAEVLIQLFTKHFKQWESEGKTQDEIRQAFVRLLIKLDGVYAFAYEYKGIVYLARDLLGVKPLWYSRSSFFAFASEKKALLANEIYDCIDLHPRTLHCYEKETNTLSFVKRPFFSLEPEHPTQQELLEEETYALLYDAVRKRITNQKVGLLFSGGIDSVFVAFLLKELGVEFTCYTAAFSQEGFEEAEDLIYAKKAAELLDLDLKVIEVGLEETEEDIPGLIDLLETTNVVKIGVALPFYYCCKAAQQDGVRVLYSGLGSEEIFAGYERHEKSQNINQECLSGLRKMYERDLYRDDVLTMAHCIELRLPFLDKRLVSYALKIPESYKITDEYKKKILRDIGLKKGIPETLALRKKKAAQYGSKFDRALERLAKNNGFSYKAEYLNSFSKNYNLKLGALWSTGKDSAYAAYLMTKHHYQITCLLTMESKNSASYMFHTPNVSLASLHAQATGLPLLTQETQGEKEAELDDLQQLLKRAKEEHQIDGVITGALFSTYQRERVEKVAEQLRLKVFSPLWHKHQEEEMREILKNDFHIMLSSVAAEGLDETWLGRELSEKDVDKLAELEKKYGVHVAGEGGEFESLVLDCPLFAKKLVIDKAEVKKDGSAAHYVISEAHLENK